jgi:MoxR-like ATPase
MSSATTSSATKTNWELSKLLLKHSRRILKYGPPSTGKSHIAIHEPHTGPIYNVTITDEMPSAELRGHYIPKGGEFIWQDGPALRAWRDGGRLVINELDKANGDILSFLLAYLDDNGTAVMTLPTGETVRPHPQFQAVATMNGRPDDLPEALQTRFPVRIEVLDPNPAAIASLPEDLQEAARGSCINPDPQLRITLRSWFEFAFLRGRIGKAYAAEAVFGTRAADVLAGLTLASAPVPRSS